MLIDDISLSSFCDGMKFEGRSDSQYGAMGRAKLEGSLTGFCSSFAL